ncbi:MAG TPA: flagellar biosynthetic protein FliO [Pseudomonadales bacterium]|nr:flagellar biosynthetic protein FliO [Pseudomonadales bacterium]
MSFPTKLWQFSSIFLTPSFALAEPAVAGEAGQAALGKLVLGLLAVLAIIYACAWAMKRLRLPNAFSNSLMKIEAVIPVGAREKIALLRVGDQQLVVGITSSSIQTLHVLAPNKSADSVFAQQLQQAHYAQRAETELPKPLAEVAE